MRPRPGRRVSSILIEMPFDRAAGFDDAWWSRHAFDEPDDWYSFYDEQDVEVARAEVERHSQIDSTYYTDVVLPPDGFAEVTFFEVREQDRRGGVGTRAIELLAGAYPGRRLAAFSEEADQFWGALGWSRHLRVLEPGDHPDHYRTLFCAPA